jgi:glycosyltransferase involved in cell wall biosynthesis
MGLEPLSEVVPHTPHMRAADVGQVEQRGGPLRFGPRVVRVVARLNVGGPAWHVVLLSAGTEVRYPTLLVAGNVQRSESDMSGLAQELAVELLRVPALGRNVRPLDDLAALWKLWRVLRATRPEIVHTHTAKAGTLGRLAAWLAGVPIRVHTFHGHVFHGYFGRFKTFLFLSVERALARITTKFVAISPRQAEDLRRYLQVPAEQIAVIPLGLDLDRFLDADAARERRGFRQSIGAGSEVVIAMVGRLTAIKNHALAIRALSRLSGKSHRFLLVIAGGGEEEPALRDLVARLRLEESVRFLGWRHDLEAVYYGSDIVALSSDNEGTPVCLIEALSCGRPVVATNVGGVPDLLEDGRLGVLVPPRDEGAFANALVALANAPARQNHEIGPQTSIGQRYGIKRLVQDVERLYDELVALRSTTPG